MQPLSNRTLKAKKQYRCDYCCSMIEIGTVYERSLYVYDRDFLTWKAHVSCQKIAEKLKMFDDCDEGLTTDDFAGNIEVEYEKIMSANHKQIFESKNFKYPEFDDLLNFVKSHHLV